MLSKFEVGKKIGEDSSNRKLNEIEAIYKQSPIARKKIIIIRSSIPKVNTWSKLIGKAHLYNPN